MKTIIAGVDFSPPTEGVVKTALGLTRALGGKLFLIHVSSLIPIAGGFEAYTPAMDDLAGERVRIAREQLDELCKQHKKCGIEITGLVFEGVPAEHIVAEAARQKADLIVLGSHGVGIIHRLFVGSTAMGVLKHASCPVVVVPNKKPAKEVAIPQTVGNESLSPGGRA